MGRLGKTPKKFGAYSSFNCGQGQGYILRPDLISPSSCDPTWTLIFGTAIKDFLCYIKHLKVRMSQGENGDVRNKTVITKARHKEKKPRP